MSFRHLRAVIRKEIRHILRDRTTLVLVLLTPITILFIMAYALTVDIEHIPVAVWDQDRTATSRSFIQRVTEGKDLDLYAYVNSFDAINDLLMYEKIKAALIIQPTFEQDLLSLRGMPLQIIIDGTEPQSGNFAVEQIGGRAEAFVDALLIRQMPSLQAKTASLQPIDLRVRALYNPGLKPRVDMVPGLISMALGMPALSVALTLAHEREHGTLEQIMVTPVSRAELLLGKIIPYIFVGLINVVVIPAMARVAFHIPFNGSFPLFFGLSAVFLFAMLSMGMLIGVLMHSQPAALALSFLLIFFPGFFMTGIFFPLASMPPEVRLEAMSLPGTHYAIITRGIFLPGVGLDVLWPYTLALAGLGIAFTVIGAFLFKKKLG
jgi:drug efflux transport system permease protein